MKPEHPLVTAARLMDLKRLADSGTYEFYPDNLRLALRRCNSKQPPVRVIYKVTAHQINNGLTSSQWSDLDIMIRSAMKARLLK